MSNELVMIIFKDYANEISAKIQSEEFGNKNVIDAKELMLQENRDWRLIVHKFTITNVF